MLDFWIPNICGVGMGPIVIYKLFADLTDIKEYEGGVYNFDLSFLGLIVLICIDDNREDPTKVTFTHPWG